MGAGPCGLTYKNKNFTTLFAGLDQTGTYLVRKYLMEFRGCSPAFVLQLAVTDGVSGWTDSFTCC